jgi:hypothetical protein
MAKIYLKNNSEYIEISKAGKKVSGSWVKGEIVSIYQKQSGVWTTNVSLGGFSTPYAFGGYIPTMPDEIVSLSIEGASKVNSTSAEYVLLANGVETTGGTWSIISGGTYASVSTGGTLTVNSSATGNSITIQATLDDLTATKEVYVTYNSVTSSETTTNTTVDESGNTTTTVTTVTDNGDGTTTSESTTITYSIEGEPVERENENTDEEGNVSTQGIVYDNNGNEVVTSYTIDTSEGEDGGKVFNGDGVNTEYYAFDLTQGFVVDIDFVIDFVSQPNETDAGGNHHNILTAKRADPEPWYGFQIRHSNANKYIQLGAQFSNGSNVNTQISPSSITGNVATYSLKITYDPTAASNNFICYDNTTESTVYTASKVFPDLEELKYLKVTLGYAMKSDGSPYRYSNINVQNFSIRRLTNIYDPVISCDGQNITIVCETVGATIYYRLNQTGSYVAYTSPISITADTIVQAYAEFGGERSTTVLKNCLYDNGIERPTITCDGEYVTIDCGTPSVDIYYRLDQTGSYAVYTEAIEITADTFVESYAELNGEKSPLASQNCVYSPIVLAAPTIMCNGSNITISCSTRYAAIYYKLNQAGNYSLYSTSIPITADTFVETYSQIRGHVSSVVSQNCEYNPVHDYSQDYLTFRVLNGGTIMWRAMGSNATKTIEYSKNNEAWSSITSTSAGVSIQVNQDDVVRFKGSNTRYCEANKNNYSAFYEGTALYDIEGNVMSLIYGDNFVNQTTLTAAWALSNVFNHSNVISAENVIMPATTLTNDCYRATFANCSNLTLAPKILPATTLATDCYYYMFDNCVSLTTVPELPSPTLVTKCYYGMFHNTNGKTNVNYIKCLATNPSTGNTGDWVNGVAASGTFVKASGANWTIGVNGIPNGWVVVEDGSVIVDAPSISCDGEDVTITCATQGANIHYRLNQSESYSAYTTAIPITANTVVQSYAEMQGTSSVTVTQNCEYLSNVPFESSNRDLTVWTYNNNTISTPYSVNAIDGHSSSYARGTFNFETNVTLRDAQPTYLWFQHADQSASIYVDNVLVGKHLGGYTSFFYDISNAVHSGTNVVKVALKNNEGNNLAPAAGDFNFNATLGNVKLYTSPYLPAMNYGYDGFHITSTVSTASATINVKTSIPTGATVVCSISGVNCNYTATSASTNAEMTFTTTITNPRLWHGTIDPYLYNVKLEIYHGNELYHRYERPYGLRFYEYVINQSVNGSTYTGFLLNGSPYLLRGVCMHDDLDGKANALNDNDYTQEFNIVQELGCNFIRLAHYPHPKEVYDWCDRLGIVVQTEAPCVNKLQTTMPTAYYDNLTTQYTDMVNQHYNHPCIMFWGLSNETTTDDKAFGK